MLHYCEGKQLNKGGRKLNLFQKAAGLGSKTASGAGFVHIAISSISQAGMGQFPNWKDIELERDRDRIRGTQVAQKSRTTLR